MVEVREGKRTKVKSRENYQSEEIMRRRTRDNNEMAEVSEREGERGSRTEGSRGREGGVCVGGGGV